MTQKTYAELGVETDVSDAALSALFTAAGPLKSVTAAILKAYFTDASVLLAGSTMTGPLALAAGIAATPSLTFAGDLDVGLYRIAANRIGVSIAGATVAEFAASGIIGTFTGNIAGNVTGDVVGDVTGDLTGNVTGNLTGSVAGLATLVATSTGGAFTPATTPPVASLGYLGHPADSRGGALTLAMTDCGKLLDGNVTSATIPLNATVAFPLGTDVELMKTGATGVWTIIPTGGVTLNWSDGTSILTGTRTIGAVNTAEGRRVRLWKGATNVWWLSGDGIS